MSSSGSSSTPGLGSRLHAAETSQQFALIRGKQLVSRPLQWQPKRLSLGNRPPITSNGLDRKAKTMRSIRLLRILHGRALPSMPPVLGMGATALDAAGGVVGQTARAQLAQRITWQLRQMQLQQLEAHRQTRIHNDWVKVGFHKM
jgi:hypothetical protein